MDYNTRNTTPLTEYNCLNQSTHHYNGIQFNQNNNNKYIPHQSARLAQKRKSRLKPKLKQL